MAKKIGLILGSLCLAVLAGCGTYGYQQDRSTVYQQDYSNGENWTINEPREVVMIPGSRVYFVPNLSFHLFFYDNYWWSPRGNQWYRSSNYNGPWRMVEQRYVPVPVYQIPKNYRSIYQKQQRIPYGQWKKQRYQWDRSDRDNWMVNEPREVVMIPGSRVYFVPNLSIDLFFYNNSWWSQRENQWYRSDNYNGPWGSIAQRSVPAPVYRVPNDYRVRYEKEKRIPYKQWKKQGNDNKKENKQGKKND